MQKYVALGIGGLTLDTAVFRQQRDAPNALRQGAILVALIGLVVGVATFVGEMGEVMLTRDYEDVTQTLYDGLITMPWYEDLATYDPRFPENFRTQFTTIANTVQLFQSSVMGGALKIIAIPLLYLATWFLYGGFAHIVARPAWRGGHLQPNIGRDRLGIKCACAWGGATYSLCAAQRDDFTCPYRQLSRPARDSQPPPASHPARDGIRGGIAICAARTALLWSGIFPVSICIAERRV